jgi:hypothetical protein
MDLKNIVIGVVVVILIYLIYTWLFGDTTRSYLLGMHNARKSHKITGDNIPQGSSSDYTYSIWVYVSNWDTNKKVIFGRGETGSLAAPEVSLGTTLNNVEVTLGTYSTQSSQTVNHTCTLENIPLQAWANIIVTLNNRALDLYLDGKLVRTCVLPGVPKTSPGSSLVVTPGGGFDGYTSNFLYFSRAVNPREAYAIYREGPGGSNWFSGLINKYRIRVEFMKDNKVMNEFDI